MSTSCSYPNFDAWLQTAWGAGGEYWSAGYTQLFQGATNLVFGANPPYYLNDFLCIYPKFFGLSTLVANCATTQGSPVVMVPSVNGLGYGQFLQGAGVPKGSVIIGIGDNAITLSQPATANGTVALQVYQSPPVPVAVILLYMNLANASLAQARWQEQWYVAMAWFTAHYLTLYAKTDASELLTILVDSIHGEVPAGVAGQAVYTLAAAPPGGALQSLTNQGLFLTPGVDYALNGVTITLAAPTVDDVLYATWPVQVESFSSLQPNGAQIAAQGLAGGIQTSKSVGDVSVGYTPLASLESWGQWNLTTYGQQLATMAAVVGSGPMVIW